MREWLDDVKGGYGGKFASAFEACGIEDQADLANVDEALAASIFASLRESCGAKELHTNVLHRALVQASGF